MQRKITVEFQNVDLAQALQIVFHAAGSVKYRVDPEIDLFTDKYSISMKDAPLGDVLDLVLRTAGPPGKSLPCKVDNGVFVISVFDPMAPVAMDRRVTINAVEADLRDVLKRAFEQTGTRYEIDTAVVGTVTVSLKDTPLLNVGLHQIIRCAKTAVPVTFRSENGTYMVLPQSDYRLQGDVSKLRHSMTFKNADLRIALRNLLRQTRSNYSFGEEVQGSLTMDVQGVPFAEVLDKMISASKVPLSWRMEDHVYVVEPKETTKSR